MCTQEFSSSFTALTPILMSFARQLTNNNDCEAEDLYQETALRSYKYRHLFTTNSNFRAWLMTIMRNIFINQYRLNKRRQHINDPTETSFLINSHSVIEKNTGESRVTMEELEAAINTLDETLRVPFLKIFEGYKYEEVANELELPLGTVKSRVFFARKRLQKKLKMLYGINHWTDLAA